MRQNVGGRVKARREEEKGEKGAARWSKIRRNKAEDEKRKEVE